MISYKIAKILIDERGCLPDTILYKKGSNFGFLQWKNELIQVEYKVIDELLKNYKIVTVDSGIPVINLHIYEHKLKYSNEKK